jgi:hypothetical protein
MSGLLILGTDGLLHLARVEHDRVEVEVFARPRIGREILSPVWGPDGSWVAWSESDGVDGRIRVMGVDGDVVFEQSGFPAFCLDPSPDGSRLAQLASGPLGLELGVLEVPGGGSTLVARGAPLYWCWAPSGKRLAVHVEERVVVADLAVLAGAVVEHELVHRSDRFLSPWWSPGGQELVLVDDQQRLVAMSVQDDVVVTLAEGQPGYRFAVAPDGRRIAVVTQRGDAGTSSRR